ncbi:putative ribonuclease H-like domain-containing protein [Tanacetum coccineum]
MSPPIRRKYRASVAFATGCRRINKSRRCNRKIRVPIAMWPCKVEEKMTLKEVDGKTIQEFETKIIAKDGTITRVPGTFQGYETSEEESVERPRKQDEDEVERNEVDSDLESTASSKPVWEKTTKADRDRRYGVSVPALHKKPRRTKTYTPYLKAIIRCIQDLLYTKILEDIERGPYSKKLSIRQDLNSNFLSNLPPEWNTHVVVWMNKAKIKTTSIDDLYNNSKIIEQSVKKSVGASSGAQNLAFMTVPSTSSTNDTAKHAYEVSIVSPNVNTASPQVSTASFSDNDVYAFMVKNLNGSNLLQQDLEQIHEDDLEVMDLKWRLSLLSMRAKRYYQRTGKKIFINANDTAGYDTSKVECFNCHKIGHFSRECRALRNKEGQFRNQDNTRKHGNNKNTSSKAMLVIDGVGFDWSDMAEEQVQTNMALMAFLDSEVYNDKTCSKTCLKNYETLKKQCDDLIVKLNQTEFTAATYKIGLATVEEQLIIYRKNEVLFSKEVAVLKREVACKDYESNVLKSEFEKVKQEKEAIEFRIEKFDKASKDIDKLLGSQITDKSKKGLGYNVIPPPHPLIYNRPKKLDLSYSGLDEFKDPEFKNASKENSDDSLIKEQVSEDTSSFVKSPVNIDKETIFLADKKKEFVKPKIMKNQLKSQLGTYNYTTNRTHPDAQRNMVPRAGGAHGGRIYGKGTLKTDSLDFKDVYFVNELKFNLFSVSQMCDKKNYVLFTDTECLVLSPNFKLPDESQTLLKIPRMDNMRLGHINLRQPNKLVKGNLVRGLPTKRFENGPNCIAISLSGKQHRASCKSKVLNLITKPLFMLHMDLFGPTFVSSIMHKKYCLVVTDDYSRFTWVFFLTTKDETSEILKNFIKEIENLVDKKVKIIRCDNGTEFKNKVMDDFCKEKGIRREYSIARTPQQNGVAERRNMTLIEAARTMLADSKLPL